MGNVQIYLKLILEYSFSAGTLPLRTSRRIDFCLFSLAYLMANPTNSLA